MITRDRFFHKFNGHKCSYSSFLVLHANANQIIKVLNMIDPYMAVGSGEEKDGNVYFEVCGEYPNRIHFITAQLQAKGFADTNWDETYTLCSVNGHNSDDFIAEWISHKYNTDNDSWDAFVELKDPDTGAVFNTGAVGTSKDIESYYADMVRNHPEPDQDSKSFDPAEAGVIETK